jgi:hypothetical protein
MSLQRHHTTSCICRCVQESRPLQFFFFKGILVWRTFHGKMEEDVKPEDEDGVDGRGMAFGLVRGAGAFAAVLRSFP